MIKRSEVTTEEIKAAKTIPEKQHLAGIWWANKLDMRREKLTELKLIKNPSQNDKNMIAFLTGLLGEL